MDAFAWVVSGGMLAPFLVANWFEFTGWRDVVGCTAVALLAFCLTDRLLAPAKSMMSSAGLSQVDPHKSFAAYVYFPLSPTALGLVPGLCYILALLAQGLLSASPQESAAYIAVTLTVSLMTLLGFICDVLHPPRSYRLVLQCASALPLLPYSEVPGDAYRLVLCVLPAFCADSLRASAGVNAMEVGQAFVLSCAVLTVSFIVSSTQDAALQHSAAACLFPLKLALPLVFVTYALLKHCKHPASVFGGDTFAGFAGGSLAAISVIGQFPRTLLLLFTAQIADIALTLPELFGFRTHPRGRLPHYDPSSRQFFPRKDCHTLTNAYLNYYGPLDEAQLVTHMLLLQIALCTAALILRCNAGLI